MPESLFNKVVDILPWNFKLKTASRIFLMFFNEFWKYIKSTFLQDRSRRLLLIFTKLDTQSFNSKQIYSLDLYCRHAMFNEQKRRFQDFHFTVARTRIQGFFGSRFFRFQVFQGANFSGSRFLRVRVQVFEVAQKYDLFMQNIISFK